MHLRTVPVSRCLDKRLKIFGFEIPDVLLIFSTLSVLNFIFGAATLKIFLVWLPTVILAAVLYFGKRGKPENYLVHWVKFQSAPGVHSAFALPSRHISPPKTKKRK